MAYCDKCGNFDSEHEYDNSKPMDGLPDDSLYFYWDSPIEEDYDWRENFPNVDCMCEICLYFDPYLGPTNQYYTGRAASCRPFLSFRGFHC